MRASTRKIDGVVLSAVLDPHPHRAAEVAMPLGGRAFHEMDEFLAAVDVVTIASPATVTPTRPSPRLAAGKHVYIEKPIAVTLAQADRRVAAGEGGRRRRLRPPGAGGVPRDGPAGRTRAAAAPGGAAPWPTVRALPGRLSVLDLMIHDLDLALSISAADPVTPRARSSADPTACGTRIRSEVSFEDGFTAIFDASRLEAEPRRRHMKVVYPSGEVEIDFVTREFRNTTPFALNPDFADTPAASDPWAPASRASCRP
jgi:predicted dehydrogenase